MFSRLTRWLDRLIPVDFRIEHKPGAQIGLTDYLSLHPSREATPISTYDNMFTFAKINLIRTALGFNVSNTSRGYKSSNYKSKGPHITAENQQSINRLEVLSRDESVEGGKTCKRNSTNQIRTRGLSRPLRKIRTGLLGFITQSEEKCLQSSNFKIQNSNSQIAMNRSLRKCQKISETAP